jgi:cysteine desulfurase
MKQKPVYFDFNATTPISVEVRQNLIRCLEMEDSFGNPSSIHWAGRLPKLLIRESRQKLADFLGCQPLELIFTSGGTESNNTVLRGVWTGCASTPRQEFITSAVEHPSVRKTLEVLEQQGAKVHTIPVNRDGTLDLAFYRSVLSEKTALVSVMAANNETGVIHPLQEEMIALAHAKGALFHSDMVQTLGKVPVDLRDLNVDFASFSAHKFYALKGTGLLYVKRGSPHVALITGGAQERNRRGGTENTLGIHALGLMAEKKAEVSTQSARLRTLRDQMEQEILRRIPEVSITGVKSQRLANTSSLILNGVDGETLLMSLDLKGFAVSTGAACSSGSPEPSPVLLAMGLSRAEAQNSLRISLGWNNTEMELKEFVNALEEVAQRLRNITTESGVKSK